MAEPLHLAVVDDEPDITDLVCNYAAGHGFRATALHCGADLLELLSVDPPVLVLLDLGLPGEDGLAVARKLRERARCGLIIVSGRGDAVDKVVGLEIGADDYVTKPFDLRELIARVKAVLRRIEEPAARGGTAAIGGAASAGPAGPAGAADSTALAAGEGAPAVARAGHECLAFEGFVLDLAARRLLGAGAAEVALTAGEFDLLRVLAQHPGRVLTRDFLLEHTRGRQGGPFERTIDVQIGRLRKKMEADPEKPQLIKSVRGAGYLFVPRVRAG